MVFRTHLVLSLLFRSVIRGTIIIGFDVAVIGSDTGTGSPFITLLKLLQVRTFYSFIIFLLLFFTFITITFF